MNSELDLSKKCILYIDDNAASIEAALAIFEDDYNYTILSELTVEEGLETLENYYGTIDAIILDLSFPETKLQGKDGLLLMKEKYGWIPIFILTGTTDHTEQAIAQECLSLGAEQVFHKAVFDVQVFMDQVATVAHRKNISQQLRNIKDYRARNVLSPYLKIVDHETHVKAVFAFKLDKILTDLDSTAYKNWAKELTQVLLLFTGVQTTQVYRNENGKIACYFLFVLTADDKKKVLSNYDDFFFNISSFFNDSLVYQPASFIPVTNLDTVDDLIVAGRTNKQAQTYEFVRAYKEVSTSGESGIGFNFKENNSLIFGIPTSFEASDDKLDILFHHLRTIPELVVLHLFNPVRLNVEELQAINKARNIFVGENLIGYKNNATLFVEHQLELFTLKTVCIIPRKKIQTVLTLINNSFYGGKAPAKTSLKSNWADYLKRYTRVKNFVTQEDLLKVIKLPLITEDFQSTFSLDQASQYSVPNQSFDTTNVSIGMKRNKTIGLAINQFQKHTYIIGKTGTGKTSVLKKMIENRMDSGDGLALIDPHGDIYKKVLQSVPQHRKKDVILFDPTDPKNEFGFSLLKYDKNFPEQKAFIVNELLKIFGELYDMKSAGGPMFEIYFKNAAYLVMEVYTKPLLSHIEKVFTSAPTRKELLSHCKNKRVTDFFSMAEATNGEQGFENFGPYITSKLTRFTDNELINAVISNSESSFNFREMIDSKKIFLVKLNKGRLGDEGVNFIGRLLFNKIIMAAYTRENIPENQRHDFSMFVDEFQNFTSSDIVSALGEARKYHLQLILANQTFAQLDEKVARNILGNVGSLITAAVSPYDAEMIAPFLEPEFSKQDIVHLDNYKFILSTQYNNKRVAPYIFNSIPY